MPKHAGQHESWEARKEKEKFVSLSLSLLNSEAWNDLSYRARALYIELKTRYYRKRDHGRIIETNQNDIHFTREEQKSFYGYDDGKIFIKDRDALIEHGFIRTSECNAHRRLPNKYGFCDKWKEWSAAKQRKT